MLKNAGITATPVIISTRDHGKIKYDYPFLNFFNNTLVLIQIDSVNLLIDGTDRFCPYNLLPENCINDRGLLINKNSNTWVNLEQNAVSLIRNSFNIKCNEKSDSVELIYKEVITNYDALDLRKKYEGKYSNLEKYIADKGFSPIDSIKIENYLNLDEPIIITCHVNHEIEKINDKIYFAPFTGEPISVNPFKQNSRNYPIDMEYKRKHQFYSEIEVPVGYKFEHLPSNQQTMGKLVQYDYKITQLSANKIAITGYYAFSQAVYNAEDYLKLKFYFDDIVKIFNNKIVVTKNDAVN